MTLPAGHVQAPGPPGLPRIGNVRAFLRDKLGFLSRCASEYGPVVKLEIGARTYLLSGPDDIKHVLVTNADNYEKTAKLTRGRGRRFFGSGLVTLAGPAHLRQRRMMQPLFHHAAIKSFADTIVDGAEEMLARWKHDDVLDVNREMLALTQRVLVRMLLGDSAPLSDMERFAAAISVRRRYQEYLLGTVLPFAGLMPGSVGRDYQRAHHEIDTIVRGAIARTRAADARSGDLISMLVHAKYGDGAGMSDEQIVDEARTLTLAGYETMAEALTWTWYLLAKAPAVESILVGELGTLGGSDHPLDSADLRRLPYTRMVLAESMRLYPPTWLFVRFARGDDVLPSGAHIPAGAKIYLSQWVMHRSPLYFPDPERFDPLRFTDEAIKERPRFTYLPFGMGRRLCIGEELAWMQGVLLIASIARRFRLGLVPGRAVIPEPNVTLRPKGGMPMRLARR